MSNLCKQVWRGLFVPTYDGPIPLWVGGLNGLVHGAPFLWVFPCPPIFSHDNWLVIGLSMSLASGLVVCSLRTHKRKRRFNRWLKSVMIDQP